MDRPARRPDVVDGVALALPTVSSAHDIPADIIVRAFVKPEGQYLRVLLRVPLGAIVDVDFPQRGPGYLDFARLDPSLPAAASRWMNDYAELYEGDRRLASPRIVAARVSLPSDTSFGTYEGPCACHAAPTLRTRPSWSGIRRCLTYFTSTQFSPTDRTSRLLPLWRDSG